MASRDFAAIEITPEVLLKAYACGIFPMAESAEDPTLYSIEPELRGIIPMEPFRIPSRLARTIRSDKFRVVCNRDFGAVIDGCAEPRPGRNRTWINERIRKLYGALFERGNCHTVEVYEGDALVGGLYGVSLGRAFFGESMFHRATDASKIALVHLVARLRAGGFVLLDTQFVTEHLATLGAVEVSKRQYHKMLESAVTGEADFTRVPPDVPLGGARAVVLATEPGIPVRELTRELAQRFAEIALGHVRREYPNKPEHVLGSDAHALTPRELHPVFYGSFDWHSCVHSYWMLARVLRMHPTLPAASRVRSLFEEQLVADKIAVECAYLADPNARGFKRPYGWGWLLKLAAELHGLEDSRWFDAIAPLAETFAQRYRDFLPIATYPVRVGAHPNTAFGLRMAADFAQATEDAALFELLRATARRWYGNDTDCPAWGEPSGDDFLSPTLIEAECMRRLLLPDEFSVWFDRFLPNLSQGEPATLFRPAIVTDRSDGKIAHLDGLSLSRAWCSRSLARGLPADDARRARLENNATVHLSAALPHLAEDYMGEHWLASFATLALTE